MEIINLHNSENLNIPFLNNNEKIKFIKYGQHHIIIVTTQNNIYGYGENFYGQLGCTDLIIQNKFIKIEKNINNIIYLECNNYFSFLIDEFNTFYFSGTFSDIFKSSNFIKLNIFINGKIKFLISGANFLFILTSATLYGLGSNQLGQLGLCGQQFTKITTPIEIPLNFINKNNKNNDSSHEIKDIQCKSRFTLLLNKSGELYVTGDNRSGQLGLGELNEVMNCCFGFKKINFPFKIKQISCGFNNSLILNENNEIFVTGFNDYGQLGMSDGNSLNVFTKVIFLDKEIIKNIYSSFGLYSIFISVNNNLYFAGDNEDDKFCIINDNDINNYNVNNKNNNYNGYSYGNNNNGNNNNNGYSVNNDFNDDYGFGGEFITKFTKIRSFGRIKWEFILPLLLQNEIFIIISDYKINNEEENNNNSLGIHCLQKLQNQQLIDLQFTFQLKKRKRNQFENHSFTL